ncbi:hypothetical protein AA313_de0205960 [Arthrobotrys entomopaga]|nr:hypothetical protein AA313_de0205960 [Arthrobotrys entomopaga]
MKVSTYFLLFAGAVTAIPTIPINSDSTLVLRSESLGESPIHVNDLSARSRRPRVPKQPHRAHTPHGPHTPQRAHTPQGNRRVHQKQSNSIFSNKTIQKFKALKNAIHKEAVKEVKTRGSEMKKEILDAVQTASTHFFVHKINNYFKDPDESTDGDGNTDGTETTDVQNPEQPATGPEDGNGETEAPTAPTDGDGETPADAQTPADPQAPSESQAAPAEGQSTEGPVAEAMPQEAGSQAPMERRQATNPAVPHPTTAHPIPTPTRSSAVHSTPTAHSNVANPNTTTTGLVSSLPSASPQGATKPASAQPTAAKQPEHQDLAPKVIKTEIINDLRTNKVVPDDVLVKIATLPSNVLKSIFEMDPSQYEPALQIALSHAPTTFYNKMLGIQA